MYRKEPQKPLNAMGAEYDIVFIEIPITAYA